MAESIFFSWQSDLDETRNVIRWALDKAVKNLNQENVVEEALRLDQDTQDVAGWPDISTTILEKIGKCDIFIADLTPINGPHSSTKLVPNPNVMFELGFALATGLGRVRIICLVNSAYLPNGDVANLPFDVRGSRPLVFSLQDRECRGVVKGTEDSERTEVRKGLARALERALSATTNAIKEERQNSVLGVIPHLATENLERFQVVLQVQTSIPFQADYIVTEPNGNVLSSIMMSSAKIDPKDRKEIRFNVTTLKPLTPGNDTYVLSGKLAHLPDEKRPVPDFHDFEVRYLAVGNELLEVSRRNPPVH